MMPSSVALMMASSDDSTIADSCASRARACSSAEMSVKRQHHAVRRVDRRRAFAAGVDRHRRCGSR